MKVIAVVGVSGVGKSTLIRKWAERFPFMHLQASALIKAEQAARRQAVSSSEDLRLGAVLDNQSLLVSAFRKATDDYTGLVLFDGHTLIDGVNGPIAIPASVFRDIGCRHLIFLHDTCSAILERRAADSGRVRPQISIDELFRQQELALTAAQEIARELGVAVTVFRQSDPNCFDIEELIAASQA